MLWFRAENRLQALEDGLDKLAKAQQSLELEWVNFYDKARVMMGRIVKRAAVVESAEHVPDTGPAPPQVPSRGYAGLTQRQHEIQQQILQRRGRNGGA